MRGLVSTLGLRIRAMLARNAAQRRGFTLADTVQQDLRYGIRMTWGTSKA